MENLKLISPMNNTYLIFHITTKCHLIAVTLVISILDELVEIYCKEVSWFKNSLVIYHAY